VAVIIPSALDHFIIAVEKTFHGASLMQINTVTIYSLGTPSPGNLQKNDGKLHLRQASEGKRGYEGTYRPDLDL